MLTYEQRIERYRAQTGRQTLTPRQRRRFEHKLGHQLDEAVELRAKSMAYPEYAAAVELAQNVDDGVVQLQAIVARDGA